MVAIIVPTLLTTFAYYYWLIAGENITTGQYYFLYVPLQEVLSSFFPESLVVVSNHYYTYMGYYHRLSLFIFLLFSILLPLIMMFKIPQLNIIKKNRGFLFRSTFIGFVFIGIIYARFIIVYGIKLEGVYEQVFLPLVAPVSWGATLLWDLDDNIWAKIILFMAYATLPLVALVSGIMIYKAHLLFFKRKKFRSIINRKIYNAVFILAGAIFLYQLNIVIRAKIAHDVFGFYAFWLILFAVIIYTFMFKIEKRLAPDGFLILYFLLSLFFQLFMLMVYVGMDYEYMFALFPLAILVFAIIFKKAQLSLMRTVTISILLVVIGLHWARRDYQIPGIYWEESVKLINKGIVAPQNVGEFTWGWYPYFFYDEGYKLALERIGDKKKITLHTWRIPEFEPDPNKPMLWHRDCAKVRSDAQIINRFYERSLFINTEFCVGLDPPKI